MKFIHLTDIHLKAPGTMLCNADPVANLDRVLRDITQWHADAEFCVISGDLADEGEPEAYHWLQYRLQEFPLPCFLMLGNHDIRDSFLEVFADHPRDSSGFVQHSHAAAGAKFIFLDTLTGGPDVHDGELCPDRLAWLTAELEQAGETPVFLFLHHPPFDISLPYVDEIKLRQPEAFYEVLQKGQNIRHIFYGHVHRMTYVNWRGYAFTSLPSTNHQIPLVPERASSEYSVEPMAYGVVQVTDDQITVHFDAYLDRPGQDAGA
jgi:3',5'-cyclic AMP phosphodiesterase CpdA